MGDLINYILFIIENPNIKKGYEDLKNFYINNNLNNEANGIEQLIQYRFKNANNDNTIKQ